MKTKIKEYKITLDLFRVDISFLSGATPIELKEFIDKRHPNEKLWNWDREFIWDKNYECTDGYMFHTEALLGRGEIFYLWFNEPTPYMTFHEITHMTGDILFHRGFEYNFGSEEAWAYLNGWIFEKFYIANKCRLKIPK